MELFAGLDIPLCCLLLPLVGLLLYIYATWPYSQFQKMGIHGPPPVPFFGNQHQLFAQDPVSTLKKWGEKYGNIYGIYRGRVPFLVINDLDIIKTVLVKDFAHFTDRYVANRLVLDDRWLRSLLLSSGADWKRLRTIMSPTFSAAKLRLMEPQINRCGRDLADNLQPLVEQGLDVDIKQYFGAYTMDVIASVAFGLEVNSQKDSSDPFLVNARTVMALGAKKFHLFQTLLALLPCLSPVVKWLNNILCLDRSRAFFMDSIRSMIQQRKAVKDQSDKTVDFMQLLINAEASDLSIGTNKCLTELEIEAQMLLFFFAGYETTSATLKYMAYCLARHPEVQRRLAEEIQRELGEEMPTYDNLSRLQYLDQTIHETLRLYPPTPILVRMASETVTIKGVTIPKGFGVMVPIMEVMRDPQTFPQPLQFDPDRFNEKATMDPITFLAFGFGPRMCIGMRLAMLEMKMAMVHVLRRFTFAPTLDLPETIQFRTGAAGMLISASPIMIKVVPRHDDQ